MSRLAHPTLGDILDRLTILSLKILHGRAAGKSVTHFEAEYAELFDWFWQRGPHQPGVFNHALQLAAVNAALWTAEDELRPWQKWWTETGPGSPGSSPGSSVTRGFNSDTVYIIAGVALRIQQLNDQRADLVARINLLMGGVVGEEKLT